MTRFISDDAPHRRMSDLRATLYLLGFARRWRGLLLVAILLLIASSVAGMAAAWTTGRLVEEGLRARDTYRAHLYGVWTLGLEVLSLLALFSAALIIPAMVLTDAWLGALVVCAMLPAVVVTYLGRVPGRTLNRELLRNSSAINSRLSEYLKGLPVLRGLGIESWASRQYVSLVERYLETAMQMNRLFSWLRPLTGFLTMLPLLVVTGVGGIFLGRGWVELGTLVTFIRYCDRIARPIQTLTHEIHQVQAAFSSGERVASFLHAATEDEELGANGSFAPASLGGNVEFREVSLSYGGDSFALSDASLSIRPGERVGFAGKTGSGKTTAVSILARLYRFQHGEVLIDGVPIAQYDREVLREQIGFVPQDPVLLHGTLRENLSLGRPLDDATILHACASTGLSSIMKRSHMTLDSEILDGGVNMSIGERQVVALTRALLLNPSILVLDEATANVDGEAELFLHRAVDHVMQGRTCIIIAHRLSTLRTCDRLFVFRDGRIVESGNHQELTCVRGYYSRLVAATASSAE